MAMMNQGSKDMKDQIDQLNSFLRGEISAVETFKQAISKVQDQNCLTQLRQALDSHQQRVDLLTQKVRSLGGTPSTESGLWGAFAKLMTGGAAVFGDKAAIAALEEGEDHGLRDYKSDLNKLSPEVRSMVEQQLLPAQQRTHSMISQLKHSFEGMGGRPASSRV